MLMNSLRTSIIIASMLALLSCVDVETDGLCDMGGGNNGLSIKLINNSTDNISYDIKEDRSNLMFYDNGTAYNPSYYIGAPSMTVLQSNESAFLNRSGGSIVEYSDRGDYNSRIEFVSPIITIRIGNDTRKIVGYPENIYKELHADKSMEFFDDIISYGMFYGAGLSKMKLNINYNPCGVTSHTALTNYSKFAKNAQYYFNVTVNSIDDITVTLDDKTELSDSGYDTTANACKFYEDEEEIDKLWCLNVWPNNVSSYFNKIPDNTTGRKYILMEPNNLNKFLGYGAD